MKPLLPVLLALLSCGQGFAQNNWNNWFFGNYAGLHFSPAPTALAGGQTTTLEGVACISDDNGHLLFYSDGLSVWDRNHNPMPNGFGLKGGWSSAQSALIVPIPGQKDRYYLFTVTDWVGSGDLSVSVVDMTLNSGLGDVETTGKNQLLATRQTEKLVAANASSCGVWVITHQRGTNIFESRLVTSTGIAPPVYSSVGSVHTEPSTPPNLNNLTGVMKVSRDNRTIALATTDGIIELFHFDSATGILSDPIAIPTTRKGYGVCFSPDNSKLYITEGTINIAGYDISQFDLATYTAAAINGSKTFVGRATQPSSYLQVGDMQAAPDGRIYFTKSETSYLGCIPSPNLPAPSCGFTDNAINLGHMGLIGLPNEIREAKVMNTVDLGNDTTLCNGETLLLTAPPSASYTWSTGAATDQIAVTQPGSYWVEISDGICFASDTIGISFNYPSVFIGNDTTLCSGGKLVLNAGPADAYLWSTGEMGSQIEVSSPGEYWAEVIQEGCKSFDTIAVDFQALPDIDLGNDTTLCSGDRLTLSAPPFGDALWSTGATGSSIDVSSAGTYWLQVSQDGCKSTDTLQVHLVGRPVPGLGNDTTVCAGTAVLLTGGAADTYLWSTGNQTDHETISREGLVWLRVTKDGCTAADSMLIRFYPTPPNVLPRDTAGCIGAPLSLHAGMADGYLWSTGDTGATLQVRQPGRYAVDLKYGRDCFIKYSTAVALNGCSCVCDVPNAFTPNGDGKNDLFLPARKRGCNFLRFVVFNRWGAKVYETTDLDQGWNGQLNGRPLDTGTYVWQILAEDQGQIRTFKGFVVLIR